MKECFELFWIFTKIGSVTFGGGYAMLPMLQKEITQKRNWVSEEDLLNYFAIGQCTPGIIFVNTATFVGYERKGVLGAVAATLGSILPSLLIITTISALFQNYADLIVVQQAFSAVRVVVGVLILNAVIDMWKKTIVNRICLVVAFISFFFSLFLNLSPIWIVLSMILLSSSTFLIKQHLLNERKH